MISGVAYSQGMLTSAAASARTQEDLDALVETVVREHAVLAFRIAYSVLRHHHDAEDAVQEVFLRVHRYRGQLLKVEDSRAWVARIAWRVATERRASLPALTAGEMELALARLADAGASAEQVAADQSFARWLHRLIDSLPADLRAPLLLAAIDELPSRAIAAILEVPEGTVRTRLARARQLLKDKLAQSQKGGRRG